MTWRQTVNTERVKFHQRQVNAEASWWQSRATTPGHRAQYIALTDLHKLARAVRQGWTVPHNKGTLKP